MVSFLTLLLHRGVLRRWLWSKHLGTPGKGGKQGASKGWRKKKEYTWQEKKGLTLQSGARRVLARKEDWGSLR